MVNFYPMAHRKLILEETEQEGYSLLALHCGEEAFKMAFLLNKHISLRLKRKTPDILFPQNGREVNFPLFEFVDARRYTTYWLVANKCRTIDAVLLPSEGLFDKEMPAQTFMAHLLPEFKKVDYFLKINSDYESFPLQKMISNVKHIKNVISTYLVEDEQIKSKHNLIFH